MDLFRFLAILYFPYPPARGRIWRRVVSAVIRAPEWPRSLLNDCLYGRRVMRLVYVDKAG